MREIPAPLQEKLDSGVTTLARCWIVTRRDGVVSGFTDDDGDLIIEGVTCRAGTGFGASEATSRFDLSIDGAEISGALAGDMMTFERHVHDLCHVHLEQHEFDALVSWSFNTGGPAHATLWRKLNAGGKATVPRELAKWNRAGGRVLAGLTRRRKAEGLMFAGDVKGALALAHA